MLDNPHYGINSLALLDKIIIHDQAFTDDIVLFFEGSNGNLEWAKEVLHHFSLTLRAEVN
jgi:hypothetical protein